MPLPADGCRVEICGLCAKMCDGGPDGRERIGGRDRPAGCPSPRPPGERETTRNRVNFAPVPRLADSGSGHYGAPHHDRGTGTMTGRKPNPETCLQNAILKLQTYWSKQGCV